MYDQKNAERRIIYIKYYAYYVRLVVMLIILLLPQNNITLEYAYEVGRVAASAARPAKKEKKADPGASPSRP